MSVHVLSITTCVNSLSWYHEQATCYDKTRLLNTHPAQLTLAQLYESLPRVWPRMNHGARAGHTRALSRLLT